MTETSESASIPRVGMFAAVRNRRGIVAAVEPFDGDTGRLHLVHLEYKDDQHPLEEQLLWELEPHKNLLEPTALPLFTATDPMPKDDFEALLRASRWTAAMPYSDPDGDGPLDGKPISSPFHGAVQVEDFQLVPLLKALLMPRVNLLIADDVGLGKTVEAGLILTELLLRRRIQRVLILTPASLRLQWRDEMWEKFALTFNLVDRTATHNLRRRLGMDANPWRSFSRIIASYHYLRQDDVLEQFLAACRTPAGSPHLPWDLLIVDECHNLMPSAFGDDSDLCRMLRLLAPQFEHRLFLSATPHNGHTRCFTGLLEILDPVRFSQTNELKPAERARVQQVVLRRLKRDINARTTPPKFCTRNPPQALTLPLSPMEMALSAAFDAFRAKIRKLISGAPHKRRRAGSFAVEILGKRLLSCPTAFAESWRRCREGLGEERPAADAEVEASRKSVERDTGDDREAQSRESIASGVVGAWLKGAAPEMKDEITALDQAVSGLGFNLETDDMGEQTPKADTRFDVFDGLLQKLLQTGEGWRSDERFVVFTEYKTTLDYLAKRLRQKYESDRILTLFGGMDERERDLVKHSFNDPAHSVRILLATDAAAEGLNLQRSARYLLHFDCPWNPSRLEQRNGRLDRHGQPRDVTIYHFVSDQDQDLRFLSHVIGKAHEIREDLGSANEIFDEAAHRRLVDGESVEAVQADLDKRVAGPAEELPWMPMILRRPAKTVVMPDTGSKALSAEMDLDSNALRDTLEAAMAIRAGRPQLDCQTPDRTCKVLSPSLPGWTEVIDETLRVKTDGAIRGPVGPSCLQPRALSSANRRSPWFFSPAGCSPDASVSPHASTGPLCADSMPVSRNRRERIPLDRVPGECPDGRRRPGAAQCGGTGRQPVARDVSPLGSNARVSRLPGKPGAAAPPSAGHVASRRRENPRLRRHCPGAGDSGGCGARFKSVSFGPRKNLTRQLNSQLEKTGAGALKREEERYRSRRGEVSSLIAENTLARLEREIAGLKLERQQGLLFDAEQRLADIDRSIQERQEEISRRTRHYVEVRDQLDRERERIVKRLLPRRHPMAGAAQVFPVCMEVRLPGGES